MCLGPRNKVLYLVLLLFTKTKKFEKREKLKKGKGKTWIRTRIQIEMLWDDGILMEFALNEVTIYPPLAFFLEGFCTAGTVSYLWSARAVG